MTIMQVHVKLSALCDSKWYELAIRFVLGGLATVLTGVIAAIYGPVVGGLFLAFPAILPAAATLVEKHERERKEKVGLQGGRRARDVAAAESAGAVVGSFGLMAFGAVIWRVMPVSAWLALVLACVAWFAISLLLWFAWRKTRI